MRGPHSYMSDFEALKTWFDKTGQTRWTLLRGFHERVRDKPMIYRQEVESMDMEESWNVLTQMIDINSSNNGGRFTVFVPTQTNGKGPTVFVQIGDFSPASSRYPSVAGAPAAGIISKQEVQEMIAKERRMWELERQIEDLHAAQDATSDFRDVLIDKFREVDLDPVISGLTQMFTKGAMPVKLQGTPFEFDYDQQTDSQEPGQRVDNGQDTGYAYEGDRLLPILDSIRSHFTNNDEFFNFLEKLALTFQQNPEMYKKMFL